MRSAGTVPTRGVQRGALLIALFLTLILAGALILVWAPGSASVSKVNEARNNAVLEQAMTALVGYAAREDNTPGTLPCPDVDNDGSADWQIGGSNPCKGNIGRLPWKTLGIGDLRDADGECLWYALSPSFRNTIPTSQRGSSAPAINASSVGELTVYSESSVPLPAPTNPAVALIIAPGPPLPGQLRSTSPALCGGTLSAADYLDVGPAPAGINNANGKDGAGNGDGKWFIAAAASTTFNDRLAVLSADQLMAVINRRVLALLRGAMGSNGLRGYYSDPDNHAYPWAASPSSSGDPVLELTAGLPPYKAIEPYLRGLQPNETVPPTDWMAKNSWYALVQYQLAPAFQPDTAYPQLCATNGSDCLTVGTDHYAQVRLQLGGRVGGVCATNPLVAACP